MDEEINKIFAHIVWMTNSSEKPKRREYLENVSVKHRVI
jgi:hypothetical protein